MVAANYRKRKPGRIDIATTRGSSMRAHGLTIALQRWHLYLLCNSGAFDGAAIVVARSSTGLWRSQL